jgi:hypothetical protein
MSATTIVRITEPGPAADEGTPGRVLAGAPRTKTRNYYADPGEHFYDWEMVDVRWDRPELLARGGNAPEELERRAPKPSTPHKKKPGDTRSAPQSGVR